MNVLSPREKDILKIIGRKKVTIKLIAHELFRKSDNPPFDSEITINNSVKRIIRKCKYHKLNWTLERTKVNNRFVIRKVFI